MNISVEIYIASKNKYFAIGFKEVFLKKMKANCNCSCYFHVAENLSDIDVDKLQKKSIDTVVFLVVEESYIKSVIRSSECKRSFFWILMLNGFGTPELNPSLNYKNANSMANQLLSKREVDVFSLLLCGFNDLYISSALNITLKTVHTHKRNIMQKVNRPNRIQLGMLINEVNRSQKCLELFC